MVKPLPTMPETWVRSLGQEDPLEKEMATYSSILAWKIPWMEELGGLQSIGSQRVGHDCATSLSLSSIYSLCCTRYWGNTSGAYLRTLLCKDFRIVICIYKYAIDQKAPMGQLPNQVHLFATPQIVAHQAPLSMGFPQKNIVVSFHVQS